MEESDRTDLDGKPIDGRRLAKEHDRYSIRPVAPTMSCCPRRTQDGVSSGFVLPRHTQGRSGPTAGRTETIEAQTQSRQRSSPCTHPATGGDASADAHDQPPPDDSGRCSMASEAARYPSSRTRECARPHEEAPSPRRASDTACRHAIHLAARGRVDVAQRRCPADPGTSTPSVYMGRTG